jgi:hypothetical protein
MADAQEANAIGIKKSAIAAWTKLSEAQEEVATYNCKDNPYFYTDYWDDNESNILSDEEAEQLCYKCPLIKLCYEFAIANEEEYGIWGGVNMSRKQNHLW